MVDISGSSFKVRIWKTETRKGARVTSYRVRWSVEDKSFTESFRTSAAADGFRSKLVTAHRVGEPFDLRTGRPISHTRTTQPSVNWFDFACQYIDARWGGVSPKHRKGIAEALVAATPVFFQQEPAPDVAKNIRSALLNWGFTARRGAPDQPARVTELIAWVRDHSLPLSALEEPGVVRKLVDVLSAKLDGTPAAGATVTQKKNNVSTALSYAVDWGYLQQNPLHGVRWKSPRVLQQVDRRVVVNPAQARALLKSVEEQGKSGPRLRAFFAFMYYSALRPEEAANVRSADLTLPEAGWGKVILHRASPEIDRQWSDKGSRREDRPLKHRAAGETRPVPMPPELVRIIIDHLDRFPSDSSGRIFTGVRGGPVASATYLRVWSDARAAALTADQVSSPLARRPYDLRHAAVSTWLNSGVPPVQVAEWAGHSVAVLLKVYAKCLDGEEAAALARIERKLGGHV